MDSTAGVDELLVRASVLDFTRRTYEEDDPYGVRFGPHCHWCPDTGPMHASTGLRFDLAPRPRQMVARQRTRLEVESRNGPSSKTLGIVELMGVQANWPLKMWWVTALRYDSAYLCMLPAYEEFACTRCAGTGRKP